MITRHPHATVRKRELHHAVGAHDSLLEDERLGGCESTLDVGPDPLAIIGVQKREEAVHRPGELPRFETTDAVQLV